MEPKPPSPFHHRDFRLFWVAFVTTGIAMSMALVAIGWQVLEVRNNPLDLGLLGLFEFVALLLFALPAGHVADRFPRRTIYALMVTVDVVVFGALLAVTLQGADSVWPFFALAFVTGTGSAFGAASGRALTPSLVPEEILVSALAHRSIAFQLSLVAGPAVGGLLFAIRAELVYIVSIVLSVVALGCVLALHKGREPAAEGSADLGEVLAGVRLIRRTRVLLGAISLDLFAVLFGGAVALLPVFAKDILEVGPTGLGFLRTRACYRLVRRGSSARPLPGAAQGRADALRGRRRLRRMHGRLRAFARDVALDARALARRRVRSRERRPALDDPATRDAR